ncbi:MAG: glycosyltransferase family 2 protein [Candidatus Omnitrophota bacterium]
MISIIVVNYGRKDLLRECLDSARAQSLRDMEMIVVDNASVDGSAEMVMARYPEVRLIRNTRNSLFCEAQNQGIEASRGDFILCLNSDCALDKDYLKDAAAAFGIDEKIGMVSGKILRPDKKTIDSTGLFLGRDRKAVERGYGKEDRGQYDAPGYVFGVSGACAFFRRAALTDVKDRYGYFDRRFGMYYEDLDLCWRARKRGWRAYYEPKALAYHARSGASAARADKALLRMYVFNRYRCMRKNDSLSGVLFNLPFILLYDLKMWPYFLFRQLGPSAGSGPSC